MTDTSEVTGMIPTFSGTDYLRMKIDSGEGQIAIKRLEALSSFELTDVGLNEAQ